MSRDNLWYIQNKELMLEQHEELTNALPIVLTDIRFDN